MAGRLLSAYRLSSLLTDIRISHARQYTAAAADAMRSSGVADAMRSGAGAGAGGGNDKRRAFWMRDPATGDWIPEDHFGETDTAELRQKLLSRK